MNLDDARKATQLMNAIVAEVTKLAAVEEVAVQTSARSLRRHVGQLRKTLDLPGQVEQDHAVARILNKLEAAIPKGSKAIVVLKLARAELRKRGMDLSVTE